MKSDEEGARRRRICGNFSKLSTPVFSVGLGIQAPTSSSDLLLSHTSGEGPESSTSRYIRIAILRSDIHLTSPSVHHKSITRLAEVVGASGQYFWPYMP